MHRAPPVNRGDAALASGRTLPLRDGAEGMVPVARGVSLAYRVAGEGPDVVIVPTAGNGADFRRLEGASSDRCIIYYDVRSRGRSDTVTDATRLGFSVEVTDLEAIRQSFGVERFSVLGWSYHGGVAATYAIQHPERLHRMVLAATIPSHAGVQPAPAREPAPHQLAQLDQLEAAGLRASDPAAFCRAWREVYVPLMMSDPAAFERMAPVCELENEYPWNVARSLVHVFAQLNAYDWRPHLREVLVPTLVVHGEDDLDPVEEAQEWVAALPDARLLPLDGVGQFPWIEAPDAFFGAVNRFLAGESI
jgi:proline iminopeptidase